MVVFLLYKKINKKIKKKEMRNVIYQQELRIKYLKKKV
jgi:hypothetical protein